MTQKIKQQGARVLFLSFFAACLLFFPVRGSFAFTYSFDPASGSPITVGHDPKFVAMDDFNGDGYKDLAVANYQSGTVSILRGNGDGTFTGFSGSPMTVGGSPSSIAIGDFNGDGKKDLAVANSETGNVSILLGNGDGTFAQPNSPISVEGNPGSVAVGDFNGDGKPDLAVVNSNYQSGITKHLSILLGNGNGTFGGTCTGGSGSACTGGTFTGAAVLYSVGHYDSILTSVAVGDFNGDGKKDLVVTTSSNAGEVPPDEDYTSIFLGNGNGTFGAESQITTAISGRTNYVAIGDFNGDGKQDLAVATLNGYVYISLGYGNGTFNEATASYSGGTSVAVGDLDGDTILDLVSFDGNYVTIRPGNGDGTFGSATPVSVGTSPSFVAIGDFTGDGKKDLAVANETNTNNVSILLNRTGPTVDSWTPVNATTISLGSSQTFTAIFSDPHGWQAISVANLYLSGGGGSQNDWLHYLVAPNLFTMLGSNDSCSPGQAKTLTSGYLVLNCAASSVSGSGNSLTVMFNVTPQSSFAGVLYNLFYAVSDQYGLADAKSGPTFYVTP